MKSIIMFLLSCCILAACESTKNNNGTSADYDVNKLEGTWDLEYLSSAKNFEGLYPANKPFMKFEVANKRISGRTSCNSFSGALVTKDSTIDFSGPIAMTKMFCPGEGEPAFTQALTRITSYKIADTTLMFMTGSEMTMRFVKRPGK